MSVSFKPFQGSHLPPISFHTPCTQVTGTHSQFLTGYLFHTLCLLLALSSEIPLSTLTATFTLLPPGKFLLKFQAQPTASSSKKPSLILSLRVSVQSSSLITRYL